MLTIMINDIKIDLVHLNHDKTCDIRENINMYIGEIVKELLNKSKIVIKILYKNEVIKSGYVEFPTFRLTNDDNDIDIHPIMNFIEKSLLSFDNIAYYTYDDITDAVDEMKRNGKIMFPNMLSTERKPKELEVYYELESRVNVRYYRNLKINGWTIILEWCK